MEQDIVSLAELKIVDLRNVIKDAERKIKDIESHIASVRQLKIILDSDVDVTLAAMTGQKRERKSGIVREIAEELFDKHNELAITKILRLVDGDERLANVDGLRKKFTDVVFHMKKAGILENGDKNREGKQMYRKVIKEKASNQIRIEAL